MKKRLLSAVVAACLIFGAAAALPQSAFTDMASVTASAVNVEGDFEYVPSANGKYALVRNYTGTASTCTIPDTLGGLPVEVIADSAFKGKTKLTRVTVPKSLRVISSNAFENCTALDVVNELRNTQLTSVGDSAFKGCSVMRSINFPKTLESIGASALEGCSALGSVIGMQNTKISSIPEKAFKGCSSLDSIDLPETLETLGAYAFYDCTKLQGQDMFKGTKLRSIGKECFTNCGRLTKLFLPSTATDLSYCCYGFKYSKSSYDFYDCSIVLYNNSKAVETAYKTANQYWYKNFPNYFDRKVKFEYIQCTNHEYKSEVTKKATCTADGTEKFTCNICGDSYTKTIQATGHSFKENIVYQVKLVLPTPVSTGCKEYKCENCWGTLPGGYKTKVTDKINVRIAGDSRYDTAIAVAEQFKTQKNLSKFGSVIVACGDDYADALSASYLSAAINAPIILVPKKYTAKFVDKAASYIANNTAVGSTLYVIGGEGAVDAKTFSQLKAARKGTVRLFGANRYETNKAVISKAAALLKSAGKALPSTAIVADGNNYADALSASATGVPIILVNGKSKTLPDNVKSLVTEYFSGKSLVIAGGEGAVSSGILSGLSSITSTKRVSGIDRYATSAAIAKEFFANPAAVTLATGKNYPDGLCAGLLSYSTKCPLLLTAKGKTSSAKTYANSKGVTAAWILGGATLVSEQDAKTILTK